jgi:hypothetical protein
MAVLEALTLSVSIERPWREVYAFLSVPENYPAWASGLASGLRHTEAGWLAQGPGGPVHVHFSPLNDHGVVDHLVVLENGERVAVPMRVVANGTGSEVLFTLFRPEGMTQERFADDAAWVRRDLSTLKNLLEGTQT